MLLATLLLTTAATATAVAGDARPQAMTRIDGFIGTWKVTASVTMGNATAKATGTWTCKRVSANAGVLCTLEMTGVPGLAVYDETDLFGFEPGSGTLHWFSVTNADETHYHVGKMVEGKPLQLVYKGTQAGKSFKEVIAIRPRQRRQGTRDPVRDVRRGRVDERVRREGHEVTVTEVEANALAVMLVEFLETGTPPPGLFTADVFCDFTLPRWRLQAQGIAEVVGLRRAGHPGPSRVVRFRCDAAAHGFVLELEERWTDGGGDWYARELIRADVEGGAITRLSVYCTGDWDRAREAEHAREVRLLRP